MKESLIINIILLVISTYLQMRYDAMQYSQCMVDNIQNGEKFNVQSQGSDNLNVSSIVLDLFQKRKDSE